MVSELCSLYTLEGLYLLQLVNALEGDKTTRVLKQNVGLNLCDVDLVNNFLDMTTKP